MSSASIVCLERVSTGEMRAGTSPVQYDRDLQQDIESPASVPEYVMVGLVSRGGVSPAEHGSNNVNTESSVTNTANKPSLGAY